MPRRSRGKPLAGWDGVLARGRLRWGRAGPNRGPRAEERAGEGPRGRILSIHVPWTDLNNLFVKTAVPGAACARVCVPARVPVCTQRLLPRAPASPGPPAPGKLALGVPAGARVGPVLPKLRLGRSGRSGFAPVPRRPHRLPPGGQAEGRAEGRTHPRRWAGARGPCRAPWPVGRVSTPQVPRVPGPAGGASGKGRRGCRVHPGISAPRPLPWRETPLVQGRRRARVGASGRAVSRR